MPNVIGNCPFPPVRLFDQDRNFTVDDLEELAAERPQGATLCIRYPNGHRNRGGYFFHILPPKKSNNKYELYELNKTLIAEFTPTTLVSLINHCTGRQFDEESFVLCQTDLNFRRDVESDV